MGEGLRTGAKEPGDVASGSIFAVELKKKDAA